MADEKRHLRQRSRFPGNLPMRESTTQMRLLREKMIPRRNRRAALLQKRPSRQRKRSRKINPKLVYRKTHPPA